MNNIFVCFLLLCGFIPGYGQGGFQLKKNKTKSRIPFELVNNLPVIKVEINGTDFSFILDTGVKTSLLFSSESVDDFFLSNTVPVQIHGLGSDAPINALKSRNNTVVVGKAIDVNHELYLIFENALNFSPRMGVPINVILGSSFFESFVVEINYISKMITLYDPDKYTFSNCKKCKDLPLNFEKGKPYINLTASSGKSNKEVTLLIDSGSSDVLWLFDEDDFIKEKPKNYFHDFLGLGLSGSVNGKRARIPELRLGEFILKNVNTSFPEQVAITKARLYEERDGSVGGGFLSRFKVIFDYRNKVVRFKKNRRFKNPFHYNMAGITIEHSGMAWLIDENQFTLVPRFIVVDVREGSPAHHAGLQKEDEVLTINGKPNYNYKLYEIINLFSSERGKKITMKIKRGNVSKKIKFYLKNVF